VRHLEEPEAQAIGLIPLVDPQEAGLDQGGEHPVGRALGETRLVRDLAEAERAGTVGYDVEKAQAAPERLRAGNLAPGILGVYALNKGQALRRHRTHSPTHIGISQCGHEFQNIWAV
jgi:hypothetical protein